MHNNALSFSNNFINYMQRYFSDVYDQLHEFPRILSYESMKRTKGGRRRDQTDQLLYDCQPGLIVPLQMSYFVFYVDYASANGDNVCIESLYIVQQQGFQRISRATQPNSPVKLWRNLQSRHRPVTEKSRDPGQCGQKRAPPPPLLLHTPPPFESVLPFPP